MTLARHARSGTSYVGSARHHCQRGGQITSTNSVHSRGSGNPVLPNHRLWAELGPRFRGDERGESEPAHSAASALGALAFLDLVGVLAALAATRFLGLASAGGLA